MKVVFTRTAEADLEEITDWIASDNPARALSFLGELRTRCLGLADNPQAFPIVPRYARLGIRRRTYAGFLIFYRIEPQAVVVLHVLHGARDIDTLIFPA